MERNEVRIHPRSTYKKLDPLFVDYAVSGRFRVARWETVHKYISNPPNAVAMEDIPGGSIAVVEVKGDGFYELRRKHAE